MGTSIDCIIPKERNYVVEEVRQKLVSVSTRLQSEFLHISKLGSFPREMRSDWWVKICSPENGEPTYITGECDMLSIDIFEKVIVISSIERLSSLYLKERNISEGLIKILIEFCAEFSNSEKMLVGAAGFGETDEILDNAYYKGWDFDQVCKKMTELNGMPANRFSDLMHNSWFLKNKSQLS